EVLPLQAAQHLRRHLDVDARERGERDLRRMLTLPIQPPGAGEEHELDVGEIERSERLGYATLPPQRGLPQEEPEALAGLKRHQRCARAPSASSTCGESAGHSGPSVGPRVGGSATLITRG